MKVNELIAQLQKAPQDALIVVRGYESGFDDIDGVTPITLVLAEWPEDWMGVYDKAEDGQGDIINAVFINQFDCGDKHILKQGAEIVETKLRSWKNPFKRNKAGQIN